MLIEKKPQKFPIWAAAEEFLNLSNREAYGIN